MNHTISCSTRSFGKSKRTYGTISGNKTVEDHFTHTHLLPDGLKFIEPTFIVVLMAKPHTYTLGSFRMEQDLPDSRRDIFLAMCR